jgi:hypothetical protein
MSGSYLCLMNWMAKNADTCFAVTVAYTGTLLACIPGAVQTADGNS